MVDSILGRSGNTPNNAFVPLHEATLHRLDDEEPEQKKTQRMNERRNESGCVSATNYHHRTAGRISLSLALSLSRCQHRNSLFLVNFLFPLAA